MDSAGFFGIVRAIDHSLIPASLYDKARRRKRAFQRVVRRFRIPVMIHRAETDFPEAVGEAPHHAAAAFFDGAEMIRLIFQERALEKAAVPAVFPERKLPLSRIMPVYPVADGVLLECVPVMQEHTAAVFRILRSAQIPDERFLRGRPHNAAFDEELRVQRIDHFKRDPRLLISRVDDEERIQMAVPAERRTALIRDRHDVRPVRLRKHLPPELPSAGMNGRVRFVVHIPSEIMILKAEAFPVRAP